MHLHHVAIWVSDLDESAAFWEKYFHATVGELYESKRQIGFKSRFARFLGSELQIELMSKPGLATSEERFGWAHIALSLGGKKAVDDAAARFQTDGRLALGPRTTGDGFYEAVVIGPDGIEIELTS